MRKSERETSFLCRWRNTGNWPAPQTWGTGAREEVSASGPGWSAGWCLAGKHCPPPGSGAQQEVYNSHWLINHLSLSLCCTCIFHYRRITLFNRESCVHQHVSQCTKQIHISNYPCVIQIIKLKLIWYFLHQLASGLKLYIYMCTSILII